MNGYSTPFVARNSIGSTQLKPKWDDLRVSINTTNGSGVTPPQLAVFRKNIGGTSVGVYAYSFRNTQDDDVLFDIQMPHDWDGSNVFWHVHWSPGANGAAQSGKAVRWALEYTLASVGGNYGVTQTDSTDDKISGTDYCHEITIDRELTMTGAGPSGVIMCRLTRLNAVANNAPVGLFALSFDLHYKRVGLGTEDHTAPFGNAS